MNSMAALYPVLIIFSGGILVILLEAFLKRAKKSYLGYISIIFLIACAVVCIRDWNSNLSFFGGRLVLDNLALFFFLLLIIATAFVILISLKYIVQQNVNHGEYFALLLFALVGIQIMLSSRDLLIIFLGLEILSMSSYTLAGLRREDEKSAEAAVKYFLLGSFASAFLVFGIALLYGASLATDIPSIMNFFRAQNDFSLMAITGLGMVIIGFGFKIAVVPFHMWTPDVYQGAPTPVTAFFSVCPKTVGFVVLLRLFQPFWNDALQSHSDLVFKLLQYIAIITMLGANLVALRQRNVKRILAYSSIAHAGYLIVAVLAKDTSGILFYLTVYLFMNIGAFASIIALSRQNREYLELDNFRGIGFQYPWIGATFAVFLFSLAGFPPTGGFLAKFYIFSAAVRADLVPLVIIGVMSSLISVYYYLRIVVYMYMQPAESSVEIDAYNPPLFFVLFFCLYGVLQLGIFPGNILIIIRQALASLPLF